MLNLKRNTDLCLQKTCELLKKDTISNVQHQQPENDVKIIKGGNADNQEIDFGVIEFRCLLGIADRPYSYILGTGIIYSTF